MMIKSLFITVMSVFILLGCEDSSTTGPDNSDILTRLDSLEIEMNQLNDSITTLDSLIHFQEPLGNQDTLLDYVYVSEPLIVQVPDSLYLMINHDVLKFSQHQTYFVDTWGYIRSSKDSSTLWGQTLDSNGQLESSANLQEIQIPMTKNNVSQGTSEVFFNGNLNSASQGLGTILHTQRFLGRASENTLLTDMYNSQGVTLGIRPYDVITISASYLGSSISESFTVHSNSTFLDLTQAIQTFLEGLSPGTTVKTTPLGEMEITAGAQIDNFMLQSDNPLSSGFIATTFFFPATMSGVEVSSSILRPALEDDFIINVFDDEGRDLGLELNDQISITSNIGSMSVGGTRVGVVGNSIQGGSLVRFSDFIELIRDELGLPDSTGEYINQRSVELNPASSNDNVTDGSIVIRSQAGKDFELSGISIFATNDDLDGQAPNNFIQNASTVEFQSARGPKTYGTSWAFMDSHNKEFSAVIQFWPAHSPMVWNWEASQLDEFDILKGSSGEIEFDKYGTVKSHSYDQAEFVNIVSSSGDTLKIELNFGSPQDFQAVTQFESESDLAYLRNNGVDASKALKIKLNSNGVILVDFQIGSQSAVAKIPVAQFANPEELQEVEASIYQETTESGAMRVVPFGDFPMSEADLLD